MTQKFEAHSTAIECEGCANSIQNSLGKLAGVRQVAVDIENKIVSAEYDPAQVNESDLNERLAQAGFPIT